MSRMSRTQRKATAIVTRHRPETPTGPERVKQLEREVVALQADLAAMQQEPAQ